MARSLHLRVLAAALLALISEPVIWAQAGRASISGVVTDSTGAVVPNASVTASNTSTNFTVNTTTNDVGAYRVPLLPLGPYKVVCRKEGFKTEERSGIVLTAELSATIDFEIAPGGLAEEVKVMANAEMINTATATVSHLVGERTILELPLNGRNPASLAELAPGTLQAGSPQGYTTMPGTRGVSANGGRAGTTSYVLDGASNVDSYNLLAAPFPNADATQEFVIESTNPDAQRGYTAGATVSIVTKSGTNSWHGNLFEFFRNGHLNSTNATSRVRDSLKRNQFGGSAGGPIKKDKMFIFTNYQATRLRSVVNANRSWVPSDAMLNGDFSGVTTIKGGLKDPATGLPAPNQYINPARFSPAALRFAASLPRTTEPFGEVWYGGYSSVQGFNEITSRYDYYMTDKHRLMFRAFINKFDQPVQTNTLLNSDRSWNSLWQSYTGTHTWTVSPTMVNSLTGTYTRLFTNSVSGLRDKDGKPICFSQVMVGKVFDPPEPYSFCSIDQLSVGGTGGKGGFGFGQNKNNVSRWTWSIGDSVTINKGKHMVVAGVDLGKQYWHDLTDWQALPLLQFDGSVTGLGMADFLLGTASFWQQGGGEYQRIHSTTLGAHVQENFKVTPNFTLTAGIRWEPFLGPVPENGRISMWFPGQQSKRYPNAPLGMVFPGDPGVPEAGIPTSWNLFNPRVGLAWRPGFAKNTSVRAAFGMYTTPLEYSTFNHTADSAPFSTTFTLLRTDPSIREIPFDDPWRNFAPTGGKSPWPPWPVPEYNPPSDAKFILPVFNQESWLGDFKMGRDMTWNLTIEHEFRGDWLFRGAYVGMESYHLLTAIDLNPQIYTKSFARDNPNFTQNLVQASWATSSYQSGQFSVEKRFSHGFQFQANYTYSKTLSPVDGGTLAFFGTIQNPRDMRWNRGWSSLYYPHLFKFNGIWESPRLASSHSVVRGILGSWQVSGIYMPRSGTPLGVQGGSNNRSFYNTGCRADLAPGQEFWYRRGSESEQMKQYFNTAAFTQCALGTMGTSPKYFFHGPPSRTAIDAGLAKSWNVTERFRLQYRLEAFNALNHPTLSNPTTSVVSGNFGKITSKGGQRTVQMALKMYF